MLRRPASLGRPPRLVAVMIALALAAAVLSAIALGGSVAGVIVDVAAVALALYAIVRWSDSRGNDDGGESGRHYGESIVDARTSVDPVIGLGPVNSEPPPHR